MNKDIKIAALLGIIQQYRIVLTFYGKKKSGGLYARQSLSGRPLRETEQDEEVLSNQ